MVTIVFSRIWEAMTLKILGAINLATYPGRVTPLPRFNFLIRALVPFAHVIASLLLNFIVIHYHPFSLKYLYYYKGNGGRRQGICMIFLF